VHNLGALAEDALKIVGKIGGGPLERGRLARVYEDGGGGVDNDAAVSGGEECEQD
jgi:hypothetical protein